MDALEYIGLKCDVINEGYADEVEWSTRIGPPDSPDVFLDEFIFVVLNSGMKASVVEKIAVRVFKAIRHRRPVREAFGHPGKAEAIELARQEVGRWFTEYMALDTDEARVDYLETLPWIGPVTKWHLAKNFGVDCIKPDRHLVRIAGGETEARELCRTLAEKTGDRLATVDTVLWRAAALGWI